MESEEFMDLPVNQLMDIISSDELNVRSEEQVFNAVMAWVKYNVTERRPFLGQVLEHVRLPLLSPKFLVGTVGSDLLIKSDEVHLLVLIIFKFLPKHARANLYNNINILIFFAIDSCFILGVM